jgi:hypothetical protein
MDHIAQQACIYFARRAAALIIGWTQKNPYDLDKDRFDFNFDPYKDLIEIEMQNLLEYLNERDA